MSNLDTISDVFVSSRALLAKIISGIVPPQEIEDIVQETYVKVCQANSKNNIRAPKAFMVVTARNLALDHARWVKNKGSSPVCDEGEPTSTLATETQNLNQDPLDVITLDSEFAQFCEAVRGLPRQCRKAFILRKVYGFSQREIAKQLGLSESTVEKHIIKGLKTCSVHQHIGTVDGHGKTLSKRLVTSLGKVTCE